MTSKRDDPTILGWLQYTNKYNDYKAPVYKYLSVDTSKQRPKATFVTFQPCQKAGLKVKRWPKLCKIRPDELRKAVTAKLLEPTCKIVHISNERDLKNILIAERRRRSIYVREERSKMIEAKTVSNKVKRAACLARKRAMDKAKREATAESCRGLPRSLVPTNIPEKYGATEECYKESAVVLGEGSRQGYVKMQACKDSKVFEVHSKYVDIHRSDRQQFANKHSQWGKKRCNCGHLKCKLFSASVLWVCGNVFGRVLRRNAKGMHVDDVKDVRLSFIHFLKWDERCKFPIQTATLQPWDDIQNLVSKVLSIRQLALPAFLAPFCKHRGTISVRQLQDDILRMGNEILNQQKQIEYLKSQVNSARSKVSLCVHDEVDEEDCMMLNVKAFQDLHEFLQQDRSCPHCGVCRSRSVLERKKSQYVLSFMCDHCFAKTTWESSQDWKQPGSDRKFIESMTVCGINYWQYKRLCQYNNIYCFNPEDWRSTVNEVYWVVKEVLEESMEIMREISKSVAPGGISVAFDTCWSHRKNAKYGSGCLVDVITRGVVARHHCCATKNEADPSQEVYDDTSASMEGHCANKCFAAVKGSLTILFACFDGDASTPQHLISHHPDAIATRDPNHIAKNVYKQLCQIYKELKYSCSCAHVINKDGKKSIKRVHNPITEARAKSAQLWVGKILRETEFQAEAEKLLNNFLDHLEGKCKPGGGCQHSFENYKHKCPVNCPEMIERIRGYFKKQVIGIIRKVIIEGVGSIHTNTNESVNMLCAMMRNKLRILGAALYCTRTDIAYLMQNQKAMTRYRPGARRHFLSEILQRSGHVVTKKQTDVWINEAEQGNIQGDVNRTHEQKQKRIQRKHHKFGKSTCEGRDSQDHYKSGGKKIKIDPDLLNTKESEDTETFPATQDALKKFTTKGLRVITTALMNKLAMDVEEHTKHIPTEGEGQKKAWMQSLLRLIHEQQLTEVSVPVDVCPTTHHLVDATELHKPEVAELHPQICKVRVKYEEGCSLLLFFDLETTGFGVYQVQMLQFGMVGALSRPGHPPHLLGSFDTYIECKMRFPEDVTALTGIKNWHHPESQLRDKPILPTVNASVLAKIIEWKKTAEEIAGRRVYSQLVSWNGDSYDVPLWMLQTDELQGKGAWGKMFMSPQTDLVAHTDLYRLTPYSGLCPKSIKDIEEYFNHRPKSKGKTRGRKEDNDPLLVFTSKKDAVFTYLKQHFPGCVLESDVTTMLQVHAGKVGLSIKHLIPLCERNKQFAQQNMDTELQKFPATAQSIKQFTTKTLRDVSTSLINKARGDVQERTIHIPMRGAGQKKAWMKLLLELIKEQQLTELAVKVKTRSAVSKRTVAQAPTAQIAADSSTAQTETTRSKRRLSSQNTQRRKRARRWVPPTNLGNFHKWYLDRPIQGYHGALADARALYDIYTGEVKEASERYCEPTKKQQNKYVAKSLTHKYRDVQNKAVQKANSNSGISRIPYGKNCGLCIGHGYPVSIIEWKKSNSKYYGRKCEVCNWAFNSRRDDGDRRRCGHKVFL